MPSEQPKIDDGGPAFPQGHMDGPHVNPAGMSLRDYFAGQALAGLALGEVFTEQVVAEAAYRIADAMLKARQS